MSFKTVHVNPDHVISVETFYDDDNAVTGVNFRMVDGLSFSTTPTQTTDWTEDDVSSLEMITVRGNLK